jgi:transposase
VQVEEDQVLKQDHHQPRRRHNRGGEESCSPWSFAARPAAHPWTVSSTTAAARPILAVVSGGAPARRASTSATSSAQDALHGIGPDTAAMLLIAAGDHPERLRSEAAWAHQRATAPIPASSGKTTRHRLNLGGDRQANHALWQIVITRMSSHPPTRAYVDRRSKEGLSKKEIIRCLKRYTAREVYPRLRPGAG